MKEDNYKFPFEKLKVWQNAKEFSKLLYKATKVFPENEKFGLTSQIRRAGVSVMSNIAEGSARMSRKDQAHFSQLAYSSLMETACQIQLAYELAFLPEEQYLNLRKEIGSLSIQINSLHNSQVKRCE